MKRFLLLVALCLVSVPAKATTYYIDLNTVTPVGANFGPCWCESGPIYPIMQFEPGSTVDFGTVTIRPYYDFHSYNHAFPQGGVPMSGYQAVPMTSVGHEGYWVVDGPNPFFPVGVTFDLIYENVTAIQLNWDSPNYTYTPPSELLAAPVPEPATWLLMLLGFASLAAFRRYGLKSITPSHCDGVLR